METVSRLERVDAIKERTGLSYSAANILLDQADGDVLQALIMFEQQNKAPKGSQWDAFEAKGSEVVTKIKELVQRGNVTKVIVKKDDRIIARIPVTAGVIGALVAPKLAIVGSVACVLGRCQIIVERNPEPQTQFFREEDR